MAHVTWMSFAAETEAGSSCLRRQPHPKGSIQTVPAATCLACSCRWRWSRRPPTRSAWLVGGAAKLTGEATGSDTIEGAAKSTAEAISAQLKEAAEAQGWI